MMKVSVVIPAYNKSELTVKAVESVLNQDYLNTEVIVVDDGSTDDTEEKLQIFQGWIKYYKKENGGACTARNFGISVSNGEYIALIDCDDVYYPNKLSKSVRLLDSNPEIGLVHTAAKLIDDEGQEVGNYSPNPHQVAGRIDKRLLLSNFINNPTVVIRKECFDEVGVFDESIFIPADWDMWLRISEKYKIGYIEETLSGYRVTSGYTISHLEKNIKEESYVLEKAIKRRKLSKTSKIIKKSYSKMYYRMGVLHGVNGDMLKSRKYFKHALLNDYKNVKTILHCIASVVFPRILSANLKKRYFAS